MKIWLEHKDGHDHGECVDIEVVDNYCEGQKDGDKEYMLTITGHIYERYSCYSVISPYGWKENKEAFWLDLIGA